MRKPGLWWSLGAVVILGMGIQIVPYGHGRTNPPVRQEPTWDNPVTRDLAVRACYDCHSNRMHSQAKLSDAEKQALMQGLQETVKQSPASPPKAEEREREGREG